MINFSPVYSTGKGLNKSVVEEISEIKKEPDWLSRMRLQGVAIDVKGGEIHALMEPNGAGKSTLGNVLIGHPNYIIEGGSIILDGKDLTDKTPSLSYCATDPARYFCSISGIPSFWNVSFI